MLDKYGTCRATLHGYLGGCRWCGLMREGIVVVWGGLHGNGLREEASVTMVDLSTIRVTQQDGGGMQGS